MNCKNCGAQLTGTENVCPNCGTPVENNVQPQVTEQAPAAVEQPVVEQPVVEQPAIAPQEQPVAQPEMLDAPAEQPQPVMVSPEEVMQQQPVVEQPAAPAPVPTPVEAQPAMVPPAVPTPAEPQPQIVSTQPVAATGDGQKNNKTMILIIALVVVAIVAVAAYFLLFGNSSESNSGADNSGNNSGNNPTEVSTTKENTVSYGGFNFEIPDGYRTEEDDEYGLIIGNSTTAFTIAVDYTNKYDAYKTALTTEYPDQAKDMVATIDGREYLALILTDEDGSQLTEYVTKASDSSAFVGIVAREDFTAPTTTEFSVLTKILDSATQGSTSFAPGDDADVGKNGIKKYTVNKGAFTFNK